MTLEQLATRVAVAERQLRLKDRRTIVAIAGTRGMVRPANDGSLTVVLYPGADAFARQQLLDADLIKLDRSTGMYRLNRLPNGAIEREAFATMIGLIGRREVA